MKRTHVDSSGIQTVGYDPIKKILEVEFVGDHVYRYLNVPEMLYIQLMKANSKGIFFNAKIRDAGFEFEKLK
jgi:hypothetical protein